MELAKNKFPETKEFGSQMKKIMKVYNSKKNNDILSQVQGQVNVLNLELIDSIKNNKQHKKNIKQTKKDTDKILLEAKLLKNNSIDLEREAWWINKKYQIMIGGGIALLLILMVLFACKLLL